jgi:hypothetical protein
MTARKSARFRGGRCFSPCPVHYSRAFAFPHSFTHNANSVLVVRLPMPAAHGLTLFRISLRAGRTLPLRRRLIVHGGPVFKDHASPRTVLVQACQHVWLVQDHDVYRKFAYVGRTRSSLAPLRLRAGRFRLALRFGVPDIRRLRCPRSFTPSCYRLRMTAGFFRQYLLL